MAQHDSMIADLKKLTAEHEEAARHLFVVCGEPSTQMGFELAWAKEDREWYSQYMELRGFIGIMEYRHA